MPFFVDQKEIQNNLLRWLNAVGSATWKEINQTLVGMLLSYGCTDDNENLKYPAYKWFEPLFRNGVIEAFFDKEVKFYPVFKSLDDVAPDGTLSSLALLKKLPSITSQINHFARSLTDITNYLIFNLKEYEFNPINQNRLSVGIYSRKGNFWEEKYLYDGSQVRLIPREDKNVDAKKLAHCFLRLNQKAKLFCYHSQQKTLDICHYQEHPILVTRALFLSDLTQTQNLEYYQCIHKVSYNNISSKHIIELKRIYNSNAVEVKND